MSDVKVSIPYQEKHSRLKTLFRPILALPILLVMSFMIVPNHVISVDYSTNQATMSTRQQAPQVSPGDSLQIKGKQVVDVHKQGADVIHKAVVQALPDTINVFGLNVSVFTFAMTIVGIMAFAWYLWAVPLLSFTLWGFYVVNLPLFFTLLLRKKYPDWWFSWNQSLQSFVLRIYCYVFFLTDRMPSLEEADSDIKLELPNPKHENLSRYMPFIKWLLIIPYMLLYAVMVVGSFALVPVSFFAIIITGKLPRFIYDYHTAVIRFYLRIASYALLLVTDKYPKMIFKD